MARGYWAGRSRRCFASQSLAPRPGHPNSRLRATYLVWRIYNFTGQRTLRHVHSVLEEQVPVPWNYINHHDRPLTSNTSCGSIGRRQNPSVRGLGQCALWEGIASESTRRCIYRKAYGAYIIVHVAKCKCSHPKEERVRTGMRAQLGSHAVSTRHRARCQRLRGPNDAWKERHQSPMRTHTHTNTRVGATWSMDSYILPISRQRTPGVGLRNSYNHAC